MSVYHPNPSPHMAGDLCPRLGCIETKPDSVAGLPPKYQGRTNILPLQAPFFENAAGETIAEVSAIFTQRGGEYADSWHVSNMHSPFLKATLRDLGLRDLTPEEIRLVTLAALVDVKDQRLGGPYKRDSLIDGVAYRCAYAAARERYQPPMKPSATSNERDLAREGVCETC